jgi:hypothetical protein
MYCHLQNVINSTKLILMGCESKVAYNTSMVTELIDMDNGSYWTLTIGL